jgi:hypothetical protein
MDIRSEKDVGYGAETSFLEWHGYLNMEFDAKENTNSNFDNHEFYLSARSTLNEYVSITAEFEYEHAPEKLILPQQAYVDFKISELFTIRTGSFYTPVGIPRSYNLRGNKNRMIRQVSMTHDVAFENWTEVGVEIMGQAKNGLFYDVAIGNGMPYTIGKGDSWFDGTSTLQSHSEDNNHNKAIYGRFGLNKKNFMGGEINTAGSAAFQKYDPDNKKEMYHAALDLRFIHNSGLRVQGEVMQRWGDEHTTYGVKGEKGYVAGMATDDLSISAFGYYAQMSYRFTPDEYKKFYNYFEPVVQYDVIDMNINKATNADKSTLAVGFVYSPVQFFQIKCEYDMVEEISGDAVDNNLFWLSAVAEF